MVYCNRCNRDFVHDRALEQHKEDSGKHHVCSDCARDYATYDAYVQHCRAKHFFCEMCDEHFDDDEDLDGHLADDHEYCSECEEYFDVDEDLHDHNMTQHTSVYCAPCRRMFISENGLNNHSRSSVHRPKDVVCLCTRCNSCFGTHSALLLHLESGRCRSRVTRQDINRVVRENDPYHVITDRGRLIEGPCANTTYQATAAAWNGSTYECYLCHDTFRQLVGLNQHLASPRHESKFYVCPLNTCRVNFSTLSGLCQHIESESCGVAKFAVVQNTMDQVMGQMRRITI